MIKLSIGERILTTLTARGWWTNTTHLVTVNINDPAIVRADKARFRKGQLSRDKERATRGQGEARRGETMQRRQVVS